MKWQGCRSITPAAIRPPAAATIFAVSVGLPSAAKAQHYAGASGLIGYVAFLVAAVYAARWLHPGRIGASISRRRADVAMVSALVVLAIVFVAIYPKVTMGSDRDEALDTATRTLLSGQFPYSSRALATGAVAPPNGGSPISPMPGELFLSIPFVMLGSGAWQTFFWLAAFFYLSGVILRSRGRALVALGAMLVLGPSALHEILTGGDLLANALWVLVLGALMVGARARWTGTVCAVLFGVGLASRAHFALLLPLVLVVVSQRRGWRTAFARCAVAASAFIAITLPFYLHDPAGFSPLHVVGKLRGLDWVVPDTVICAGVVGSIVGAVALASRRATSDAVALAASAAVLAVPVLVAVVLACARRESAGFAQFGWYGVSSTPFGVLAAFSWNRPAPCAPMDSSARSAPTTPAVRRQS
jgi:hypothetical protein